MMKNDLERRLEAAKKWMYKRSIDLPNAFRDSDKVLHELLDAIDGEIAGYEAHADAMQYGGYPGAQSDGQESADRAETLKPVVEKLRAALSERAK